MCASSPNAVVFFQKMNLGSILFLRNHILSCMPTGSHSSGNAVFFPGSCFVQVPLAKPSTLLTCLTHSEDIPALKTADFHEALFPTTIRLCLLDSAFHLPHGFGQEGTAASGQHAMCKTIPSGAPPFVFLIFKCSCFKSLSSPAPHIGHILVCFSAYTST